VKQRTFTILGGLALSMMAFAPLGKASISDSLTLTDGAGDIITIDNTGAVTFSGRASCIAGTTCATTIAAGSDGAITFEGSLGTFTFSSDTGTDPLVLMPPELMSLVTLDVKSTDSGTLDIKYQATGVTGANNGFVMGVGGASQTDPGYIDYAAYVGATLIGDTGQITASPFDGSLSSSVTSGAGPYALTQNVLLDFNGGGDDQGTFTLSTIPEPTSILLLGGALVLACSAIRRKLRTN